MTSGGSMKEKKIVEQFFHKVMLRTQALTVGTAIFRVLSLLCFGLLFLAFVVYAKYPKEYAHFVLILFLALSFCSGLWDFRNWFRDRSPLYIAKKAERVQPELRGSLLCAIELNRKNNISPSIQGSIFLRAYQGISKIPIYIMSSSAMFVRSVCAFGFAFFLVTIFQLFSPFKPIDALASLNENDAIEKSIPDLLQEDIVEKIELADISLYYEFPEYTKKEPLTVQNSDGTIHAPFNSRVSIQARAQDEYQQAFLQINDGELIPIELIEGHQVNADLVIDRPGVWRLWFERDEKRYVSDDFRLELDGDNPPIVTLESTPPATISMNQSLNIQWSAKDDYGLKQIMLEVVVNGKKSNKSLRSFRKTKLSYKGRLRYTPKRLKLKSGDQVELRVVAYDAQPVLSDEETNDEFAHIGKRGESATVSFLVIGPKLAGERLIKANQDFLKAMIPALADFLIEPVPPASSDTGMVKWASRVQKRFEPLHEATKKHWGDEIATDYSAKLVLQVLDTSNQLMRFVRTTFDVKKLGRVKKQDRKTFIDLHEQQIKELEKSIYLIDKMLRMAHFSLLLDASESSLSAAQKIDEQLARDDVSKKSKSNRLNRLQKNLKEVNRALGGMAEDSMFQFVSLYQQQINNLIADMEKNYDQLSDTEYDTLLREVTESVAEMHEGIQEQLRRQKDEQEQQQKEFEELIEALKNQKTDQLDLVSELQQSRSELDTGAQKRVEMWKELQRLSDESQQSSAQLMRDLGGGEGYRSSSIRQYQKQERALRDLQNAIKARDYQQAYRELSISKRMNRSVQSQNTTEKHRQRGSKEAKPQNLENVQEQSDAIEGSLKEIQDRLLSMDVSSQESRQMQQKAQELSQRQEALNGKQGDLEKKTEKVEQQMPTADGSASEALKEATQSMGEANGQLEAGRSIPAQGYQQDAGNKIQKTIDRLMQQQEEMQQMQQQAGKMSGKNKGEEGGKTEDGENPSGNLLDLTEEMTPEEYRKLLLEGMSGAVPEEFQVLKKRYYEELVQQ